MEIQNHRFFLSPNGILFDSQTGDSYQLNPTAAQLFEYLQNGLALEVILSQWTKDFAISESQALTDILDFKIQLRILGLVQNA